jgi:hypothetical protein
LPDHIKDKIDDLYDNIVEKKPDQTVVSELEALIDRYPKIPMLYNYLSMAYFRIGDQENYEKSIKKNYQLNPDYLFARLNYAQLCDQQGEHEKIAEIFNHKFDLKLLYPKRKNSIYRKLLISWELLAAIFLKQGKWNLPKSIIKFLLNLLPIIQLHKSYATNYIQVFSDAYFEKYLELIDFLKIFKRNSLLHKPHFEFLKKGFMHQLFLVC